MSNVKKCVKLFSGKPFAIKLDRKRGDAAGIQFQSMVETFSEFQDWLMECDAEERAAFMSGACEATGVEIEFVDGDADSFKDAMSGLDDTTKSNLMEFMIDSGALEFL